MRGLIAAPLVLAAALAAAQAQETEEPPAIEARHGIMKNYSFNLATLGGMAKGEVEYDAETAQLAADRLVTLSSIDWTGYWPEGTSSEDLDSSRALPAVWSETEDFLAGFDEMHEAAMSMQEVAGDGREAVAGEMEALGGSCGGCHDDYRMSDD